MVNATSRSLYPRRRPSTHGIRGWVGSRAGLDGCGKYRPPPVFDPWTVQPVVSRYTDFGIRYSKIWRVATRTSWLQAGLMSQACDLQHINKIFFFAVACTTSYIKKIMDMCLLALYIPTFHALIRYTDFFRTRNALECMNVGNYIVATNMFLPLKWPFQSDKKKITATIITRRNQSTVKISI
jgi:hypothetical protein